MDRTPLYLAACLVLMSSCKKEDDPAPTPPPAVVCGMDGARLQATFDGASWCANLTLFADGVPGTITISGMTQMGSTLTLELEDTDVGTHPVSEDSNTILFTTSMAAGYLSSNNDPGTVTITSHNTATRRIQGSFSANLYEELGGTSKPITGQFDVQYVE
jgi:hypothetical protein